MTFLPGRLPSNYYEEREEAVPPRTTAEWLAGELDLEEAIAGEGIYDLVLTREGYAPVIVEDVSVTAGQTVDMGTLTPRPGIYVHGELCQPAPLPADMRLLAPSTGELTYLGLISVQSTGIFGFTFPEGTYDLVLSAGERSPLEVEGILIERDEFGQCELTYGENHRCFPL